MSECVESGSEMPPGPGVCPSCGVRRPGSRSEGEYPREGTWKDRALQVAGTVVDNLPMPLSVPGSLLLSLVTPPLERLRIAFINDLAAKVRQLEESVDGFTVENNEAFAFFVAGAVQSAVATAEAEKRTMLRNAALNVALGKADQAEHLRHLLDQLTVLHIGVLRYFASPPAATGARRQYELNSQGLVESAADMLMRRVPDLCAPHERFLLEAVIQDLWDRRLLPFPRIPPPTLHQQQIDLYTIDGPRVTSLGARLLEFVSEPLSDPIKVGTPARTFGEAP